MQKYAIVEAKNPDHYLNNFRCDMGRIVFVNFIERQDDDKIMTFSSEDDAQCLCERIAKNKKTAVKPVLLY